MDTGPLSIENIHINVLTMLQVLNVRINYISSMSIPAYVINFMDFRILDLHNNNLTITKNDHTAVLRQMGNNITIVLSRNPIAHIEPGAFQNIHLQELHLCNAFASANTSIDYLK